MSFLTASLNDQMNVIDAAFRSNDLRSILRLMDAIMPGLGERTARAAKVNQQAAIAEARRAYDAQVRAQADAELRIEVVEEMVAAGIARHVAANLTNTEAKMLEQARKYGVI